MFTPAQQARAPLKRPRTRHRVPPLRAECALHIAHQARVEAWITAVSDRMHEAANDNLKVLADCDATYLQ